MQWIYGLLRVWAAATGAVMGAAQGWVVGRGLLVELGLEGMAPLAVAAVGGMLGVAAGWSLIGWPVTCMGRTCCESCGYDLQGNVSGRCPECGLPLSITTRAIVRGREESPHSVAG